MIKPQFMIVNKYSKIFICFGFLFAVLSVQAQWVSNPALNTKIVTDLVNPVNVIALDDKAGGVFVFWEDKKNDDVNDIFFIHANENGEVSFRADGKTVSTLSGSKHNPVAITDSSGNVYVLWKNFIDKKASHLYLQKLSKNGNRLFSDHGLIISDTRLEIVDYSIDLNIDGSICIMYIMREPGLAGDYMIGYKLLDSSGTVKNVVADPIVYKSNSSKSKAAVIADYEGGTFFFWLENLLGKSVIRAFYVDENNIKKWGNEPVNISSILDNVLNFSVNRFGNSVHISFQYQGQKKEINHQIITRNGFLPWGKDIKRVTSLAGNQLNPQSVVIDSTVYVTWTNDYLNDKNIYIQKFDKTGKPIWRKDGIPLINIKGEQFGQKIISDGKGNLIIAWLDRRIDSALCNIYAQKIDANGNMIWDSLSVVLGAFYNSQKSYLNLVPDCSGGAIVVFKELREGKNEISAHKVFDTGTYASQIFGFKADVENGKVKISWYSANESQNVIYDIERTAQSDTGLTDWFYVATLEAHSSRTVNYYELYDEPNLNGTLYYRIIQKDGNKLSAVHEPVKVNFLESASSIVLAQNSPNPFTDSTIISFYLPVEEDVTLEFFNSSAELIKELPKQKYSAGVHEVLFTNENLDPGIYFYRFKAGDYIEVKKMVVSR